MGAFSVTFHRWLLVVISIVSSGAFIVRRSTFHRVFTAQPAPLRSITWFRAMAEGASRSETGDDMSELFARIQALRRADQTLREANLDSLELPVIAMDALLPNQRLEGSTTDPTFGRMLQNVGLGGLFSMVSINPARRMLRRNGVICKVLVLDVRTAPSKISLNPTAVDFAIRGIRHCRVRGPETEMRARAGRWRRDHDPDGEESRLGFQIERFVDAQAPTAASALLVHDDRLEQKEKDNNLSTKEWSALAIDCSINDPDDKDPDLVDHANSVIMPLVDQWENLVSRTDTYENTDVVATARVMRGQPTLRVDPAALLRQVKLDLGPRPTQSMRDLAFWCAALINPVPTPLGVAPEIRGRILEAPNATQRLQILEWGIRRSIGNLQGTAPL